jgi:phage head maturation protease
MPWHIEDNHESCSGFAVVKDDDGSVAGCHDRREEAEAQLAALYASENRSVALAPSAQEIFTRNDAVLADVNVKLRQIDLLAVPWDQEAEVPWRGEVWREVFRRGAFNGLENHVGRVRVNREHVEGDTVGKLIHADPYAEAGLITRAQIARTLRGDDTLALAEDDMISASVGYRLKSLDDIRLTRRTRLREVLRAFMAHLSMVESPAYVGAQVLAVREEQLGLVEEESSLQAHVLDEAWSDPAYLAALDRLNSKHD